MSYLPGALGAVMALALILGVSWNLPESSPPPSSGKPVGATPLPTPGSIKIAPGLYSAGDE